MVQREWRSVEQDLILKSKFEIWAENLSTEKDFQDGNSLLKFIRKNLENKHPLCFQNSFWDENEVIGTISVCEDDQDAGQKNNIPGVWIGGFVVDRKKRGQKIGQKIFDATLREIEEKMKFKKIQEMQINLFADQENSIHIYEKFGFKPGKSKPIFENQFHFYKILKV